jgi:hypothetical protein
MYGQFYLRRILFSFSPPFAGTRLEQHPPHCEHAPPQSHPPLCFTFEYIAIANAHTNAAQTTARITISHQVMP